MKNLLIFLILIATLLTYSCGKTLLSEVEDKEIEGSEVEGADRVYANYRFDYQKNTSLGTYESSVRAKFKTGWLSPGIQLDGGSNIKFNGQELEYADSLYNSGHPFDPGEHYYVGRFPGYIDEAKFEYEDLDGNVYTNYAPLNSIGMPSGTNLTVQLGDSVELFWEGAPVGEDEEVTVSLGFGFGTFRQSQLNANSVWITAPDSLIMFVDSSGASIDTITFPALEQIFSITRYTKNITGLDAPRTDKGKMDVTYKSGPYPLELIE